MRALLAVGSIALAVTSCGGQTRNDASGGKSSGGAGAIGGTGGAHGGTGGSAGTGGTGGSCSGPNPAGCIVNACPPNMTCDQSVGCVSSSCSCTPDGWACTSDCNGGTCVPVEPVDCTPLVDAIAKQTTGSQTCTAVVRISYTTHQIISHAMICGDYKTVDEAGARAIATADSGYGDGDLIGGPTPPDEWVFVHAAADFGGVSVVSARSSLSVFGASIVWGGKGAVLYPKTWDSSFLGINCAPQPKPATIRDFSLAGNDLTDSEIMQAVDTVWTTALPAGLSKSGYVFDVMVLRYAPSVGFMTDQGFLPETAEYIVMVNSGWLE